MLNQADTLKNTGPVILVVFVRLGHIRGHTCSSKAPGRMCFPLCTQVPVEGALLPCLASRTMPSRRHYLAFRHGGRALSLKLGRRIGEGENMALQAT
mmetsp:Transcript_55595/g.180437  ORF Transcript_55595/g.180437 Transcript_55595/m.180437 type:complete len:97 (-) Transcript_55595:139-429(-)